MCSISLAFSAVSTIVGFLGQRQEGKNQQAYNDYNAAISRNNAIIAENNRVFALGLANDARDRGAADAATFSAKVRRLKGQQIAVLAANGVLVEVGSALDITQETTTIGQLDALTIRSNAEREALGFDQQASNFGAQAGQFEAGANLQTLAGQNAVSTANTRALSGLLSGAGSVASKWYNFNSSGQNWLS